MIELKQITKQFHVNGDTITALDDVSLTIEKGEIFGIIGRSGAGKSTLIRMINLLERPTAGVVEIEGQDITLLKKKGLSMLRQRIGMIFQHYNLLKTATVEENVAIPLRLEGLGKQVIRERVDRYLDIVGLSEHRNHYPEQLSGGQKQRVAIARALAHEPDILLSDESTSALDPETTESILELLLEINRELGLTIFLITHEMEVIERICDRVAVIDHGKIIEQGNVLDVFSNPRHETTQRFLKTNLDVPEEVVSELQTRGTLVHLSFIGSQTEQAVLAQLTKRFGILPNIIGGGIKKLKAGLVGNLLVHLDGDHDQTELAVRYLKTSGVHVREVSNHATVLDRLG
ncbi:ATP-binding cassette domain-containing protein [Exiguobacterium sp. AT1b]|uniref:methionine ABC transporter ATP-binding protein n=1 Tax=Exiguobacterium sp. (strain ATCC BAA-1283 / AT1b) TaxID=360911 RepID=UPI00093D7AD1|nr:ATP-binding cassette domain-containing protein [Exiguobacterium sp. AT1b]